MRLKSTPQCGIQPEPSRCRHSPSRPSYTTSYPMLRDGASLLLSSSPPHPPHEFSYGPGSCSFVHSSSPLLSLLTPFPHVCSRLVPCSSLWFTRASPSLLLATLLALTYLTCFCSSTLLAANMHSIQSRILPHPRRPLLNLQPQFLSSRPSSVVTPPPCRHG